MLGIWVVSQRLPLKVGFHRNHLGYVWVKHGRGGEISERMLNEKARNVSNVCDLINRVEASIQESCSVAPQ